MHSALVSAQSSAFDRLANGAFKEAAEFHAALDSTSEETFILFAQYAYTGSYSVLKIDSNPVAKTNKVLRNSPELVWPESELIMEDPAPEPEAEREDMWGFSSRTKKEKKRKKSIELGASDPCRYDKAALWGDFTKACSIAVDPASPRPGAVSYDGNVLLSHARLYVFADCYGIPRLADMSMHHLSQELLKLNVTPEVATNIIELLRYAYEEPSPESLRNHLALYAACKASELWMNPRFRELVATHGDLGLAMLEVMIKGRATS